jgi:hypothetical protein
MEDKNEDGNPKNPNVYFYLCQLLGHHNKAEESRKWGFEYLKLRPNISKEDFNFTIYFTMIKSLQDAGLMEDSYKLIKEALQERPNDPDIACSLADFGALKNNHYVMAEGCRRYIKGYKEMMENPAKKAGQFYFSLREDMLVLNLYRLMVASLQEGTEVWRHLKPRIQHASQDILDELKENLIKIGQEHLLKELPNMSTSIENKTNKKLDVFQVAI